MSHVPGMLTLDDLAEAVRDGRVDTVLAVFTDPYGRSMGKRLDAGFFLESAAKSGLHACDYLLTADMEMEPVPGYAFASWDEGYGDVHLAPDVATLRLASWLDRTAIVLCDVEDAEERRPVAVAPRTILRRQLAAAAEMGFATYGASELEYYLFRDGYRDAAEKGWRELRPASWYLEDYHALQATREEPYHGALRRHLAASGVPVEGSKGEWGLGQHEINVRPADLLTMADRHVVLKQCAKEVADALGASVTFMAKYAEDGAGSSCHLHLSLRRDGRPAFPSAERDGAGRGSETFGRFLAGWIARTPEVMPLYAPTVNSYKRYRSGSWAPTRLAWSRDNRTAGFRVVGDGPNLRIECRVPGADCNPYLAFAAALASGLDGVRRGAEPPPAFEGDVYDAAQLPEVPKSLREATERFASSAFAAEAFGADVVAHYAHFFRTEQEAYDRAVTDWERRRYFERI